jgi:hypothetical protein
VAHGPTPSRMQRGHMAKRTTNSRGSAPSPVATAGAGFRANSIAHELAAWAYRPGMPEAHSPDAQTKSDALAAKGSPAPGQRRGPLALGSPGRDLIGRALDMRDARLDDEGTPHTGPLALGSPGRERMRQALDMRDARLDDEGTPHTGPLALGSPGRARLDRSMTGQAHTPALSPEQSRAFESANQHFHDSHMTGHAPEQPQPGVPSGKPRGFQIHKVQAAAQAAKGNQYTGPDDDGSD